MKITAIIPAYNEESTVGDVIKVTSQYVDEILVINDGSTDSTADVAKKSGAIVVDNIVNRGLGKTIRRGYNEAVMLGADIIVQIDADKQYDPKEIPILIEPILKNKADLVLGSRLENLKYEMPWINKFGNKAFSWLIRRLTGKNIKDGQTGFRAIRKEVFDTIKLSGDFTYTQEMIIKASKEGWRIENVPINFYKRSAGDSRLISSPFAYAWRAWIIILRTIRDYDPLRFFGIPGIILFLTGLVIGSAILYKFAIVGVIGHTPAVILTVLLIISGIQLLFLALMSDMNRPQ
ncbi:MAG: glycosyltransferase family 2 protein [Candidatus Methanoperedens sp.]|nr:glycosyltransferase family 2 protein [Candidatus Methanoperedens sp.]